MSEGEYKVKSVWRKDSNGDIKFFPDDMIPQDVKPGERTKQALEAFSSQPRRR